MPKQSVEVEEIVQEIKEDIEEDIQLDPSDIRKFSVSNIVGRTFAHLIGKTEDGSRVPVKVMGDGKINVATTPGGITEYTVEGGSADDTYTSANTYTFDEPYTFVDNLIESNDALVSYQDEGGTWMDDIPLTTGYHSQNISAYGIRIKNRVSGNVADYNIILWR